RQGRRHTMSKSINGTGVVAGVAYAPAEWVRPRPNMPQPGASIAEDARDSEFDRLHQAAEVVAGRLQERAAEADGHAKEVVDATAGMVKDGGWHKAVKKNIAGGHNAEYAVVGAPEKFVEMFESAGGVMAERTTALRDVRDRVI